MAPASSSDFQRAVSADVQLVTFRGGFVADWLLVSRLLDLEARGAQFQLESEGHFRVVPSSVLSPEDVTFLRLRRDQARAIIEYCEHEAKRPH